MRTRTFRTANIDRCLKVRGYTTPDAECQPITKAGGRVHEQSLWWTGFGAKPLKLKWYK